MDEFLKTICGVFALEGDYLGNEVIKCGNINDTYRMDLRTGSGMKSYIVPVSYTHLDVYKRQP